MTLFLFFTLRPFFYPQKQLSINYDHLIDLTTFQMLRGLMSFKRQRILLTVKSFHKIVFRSSAFAITQLWHEPNQFSYVKVLIVLFTCGTQVLKQGWVPSPPPTPP